MAERVLALALLLASGTYLTAALPLPRGTLARPGPGFFPLAVGAFACVIALGWTARAWCRPRAAGHATTPAEARQRVLATAACLVGFCLLLPWLGYAAVAFLFVAVLLRRLGASWLAAVGIGLACAVVSYYLFAWLLGVPLPPGAWLG